MSGSQRAIEMHCMDKKTATRLDPWEISKFATRGGSLHTPYSYFVFPFVLLICTFLFSLSFTFVLMLNPLFFTLVFFFFLFFFYLCCYVESPFLFSVFFFFYLSYVESLCLFIFPFLFLLLLLLFLR